MKFPKIKNQRLSFENIYMELAKSLAFRSTCQRLNVGAVITSSDFRQVLAVGYNGNAAGLPNKCDQHEQGDCGCVHAEANAIINCHAPLTQPKIFFSTFSPCINCAKLMLNLGNLKKLFYCHEFKNKEPLEILKKAGIKTIKMKDLPKTRN